jgi:hypothetical protein
MKAYRLILIILTSSFLSCQDNSTLMLPEPATKIVINALLVTNQSPKVYVGKTWAVTSPTPIQTYYDNAQVSLWEDGKQMGSMMLRNGMYELSGFLLKPQKSYKIQVEVPSVGKAESQLVMMPPEVQILSAILDQNTNWVNREIYIQNPVRATVVVKNNFRTGDYLVTSAVGMKDNQKIYFNSLTTENGEISSSSLDFATSGCYALFPELSDIKGNLSMGYNSKCFSGNTKEVSLIIDKTGQIYNNSGTSSSRVEANAMRVYLAIYSAEYLQYAKAAQGIEGADNAFIETKPTYSNIVGGIGFVTAISLKDTTFKF